MADFKIDPDYKEVAERLRDLFAKHPEARLQGDWKLIEVGQQQYVVYRAECYRDALDEVPGVGTALEQIPGTTPYTKGSEIQNAETSAWGRAIVAIGASESKRIASAEDERNSRARAAVPEPPPISQERIAELEARCKAIDAKGGNGTVVANRKRWRLPPLHECDAAALVEFDAMLTQVEQFLASQAKDVVEQAGDVDGPIVREEPDIGAVETEEELRARIEAEVAALQPVEVRKELNEGKLELTGNPKMLRERLVAYKVWCALGQDELPPADPSPQEVLVAEEIL